MNYRGTRFWHTAISGKDYLGLFGYLPSTLNPKRMTRTNMAMGPLLATLMFFVPSTCPRWCDQHLGLFSLTIKTHFRLVWPPFFLQNYITYILKPYNYLFVKPSCWLRKFCNSAHWKKQSSGTTGTDWTGVECQVWAVCGGAQWQSVSSGMVKSPWWKAHRCEWPFPQILIL